MRHPRLVAIGVLVALPTAGLVVAGCGDEAASRGTTAADRNAAGAVQRVTTGQKAVVARLGTTFVVSLREKPATGYRWEAAGGSAASSAVNLVGVAEVPVPENPDAGVGTGGAQITREFTYAAVKEGQGTVKFAYARPWEDTPLDTRTFDVMVTR